MAKRKRKRGASPFGGGFSWMRSQPDNLEQALNDVDRLIDHGRFSEALERVTTLQTKYPKSPEPHYYAGYIHAQMGNLWEAVTGYEWALDLNGGSELWLPLGGLYLQLDLKALALNAFRKTRDAGIDSPEDNIPALIDILETEIELMAANLNISRKKTARGLRLMEEGQEALQAGDYPACIRLNRQAIAQTGNWPPPHNNISIAQFYNGQPQAAIDTARAVLASDPHNLQALSNIIRYLAWSGQKDAVPAYWHTLRDIPAADAYAQIKKAEAAAIAADDAAVYDILTAISAADTFSPAFQTQVDTFLAVAEANLGHTAAAKRRFKHLKRVDSRVTYLLKALQNRKPGPGISDRFPYFHSTQLVNRSTMDRLIDIVSRRDTLSEKEFRAQMDTFAAQYPQYVLIAEKFIYEEDQVLGGIQTLFFLGTPAAHDALRTFATGQRGTENDRMEALMALAQAGQLPPDTPVRFWRNGQWEDVLLQSYNITPEREDFYPPEIEELMLQAHLAGEDGDDREMERLLKKVLAIDPNIREVYNNLGTIYISRDDMDTANRYFQRALEIDPLYVFPRCNLALDALGSDAIEDARALLDPLNELTRFHPQEMAFLSYTRARLSLALKEYDNARNHVEISLQINPDFVPAQKLLQHLSFLEKMEPLFGDAFIGRIHAQNLRKRQKQQTRLTALHPSLAEALSIFTKDELTAIARVTVSGGGWSTLRKAELLQRIHASLTDNTNIERLLETLTRRERMLLQEILADDGHILWDTFDSRFDNDMEESPHWIYHTPASMMGRLRLRVLLTETTTDGQLWLAIPAELRQPLTELLATGK